MALAEDQRYDWLIPDVLAHAQDALTQVVVREIKRTCIELCEKALVWQVDHVGTIPAAARPAGENWTIERLFFPGPGDPPAGIEGLIVDLRWLRIFGHTLEALPLRSIDKHRSRRESSSLGSRGGGGRPAYYSLDFRPPSIASGETSGTNALLWPELDGSSDERYEARFALKPVWNGEGIPAHGLLEEYREAIVEGAVAKMLRLTNYPFADANLAELHQSYFDEKVRQANARARGRTIGAKTAVRYGGIPFQASTRYRNGYGDSYGAADGSGTDPLTPIEPVDPGVAEAGWVSWSSDISPTAAELSAGGVIGEDGIATIPARQTNGYVVFARTTYPDELHSQNNNNGFYGYDILGGYNQSAASVRIGNRDYRVGVSNAQQNAAILGTGNYRLRFA